MKISSNDKIEKISFAKDDVSKVSIGDENIEVKSCPLGETKARSDEIEVDHKAEDMPLRRSTRVRKAKVFLSMLLCLLVLPTIQAKTSNV